MIKEAGIGPLKTKHFPSFAAAVDGASRDVTSRSITVVVSLPSSRVSSRATFGRLSN